MLFERPSKKFEDLVCSNIYQIDPDLRAAHEDFSLEILFERKKDGVVVDDPFQFLFDYYLAFVGKGADEEGDSFCPAYRRDRGTSLLNRLGRDKFR